MIRVEGHYYNSNIYPTSIPITGTIGKQEGLQQQIVMGQRLKGLGRRRAHRSKDAPESQFQLVETIVNIYINKYNSTVR